MLPPLRKFFPAFCFRNFECTLTAILPGLEQSLPHIFRFVLQLFYFSSTFLQLANSVMLLTVTILTILSNLPVSFFYLATILQINIYFPFSPSLLTWHPQQAMTCLHRSFWNQKFPGRSLCGRIWEDVQAWKKGLAAQWTNHQEWSRFTLMFTAPLRSKTQIVNNILSWNSTTLVNIHFPSHQLCTSLQWVTLLWTLSLTWSSGQTSVSSLFFVLVFRNCAHLS